MKKTITKFTLILAATIFTLPTCLIAKDNSTKQNDIKSEKIITYVGAYGGLGNYNANIGISSAIFKKWLPDYQKFAFDVEIGHASESKTYDSVNGGSSLVSVKQTTKEDSSANYLLVNTHYELDLNKSFTPYLVVGLGFQSGNTDLTSKGTVSSSYYNSSAEVGGSASLSGFIYQIGIGCTLPVAEKILLDGRVRYATVGTGGVVPQIGVRVAL